MAQGFISHHQRRQIYEGSDKGHIVRANMGGGDKG